MRESTRHSLLLVLGLGLLAASLAVYASWVLSCFRPPSPVLPALKAPVSPENARELAAARARLREDFLNPQAHLRLSEALFRSGRPADAFYVMAAARRLFGEEAFAQAHSAVVLGRAAQEQTDPSPEGLARLRERLKAEPDNPALVLAAAHLAAQSGDVREALQALEEGLASNPRDRGLLYYKAELTASADPAGAVPSYARLVNASPDSYEGRRALDALGRLAQKSEDGPEGEAAREAWQALQELYHAKPEHSLIFTTLAMSAWARGEGTAARALAAEARERHPDNAGAMTVEGALAYADHNLDKALELFSKALTKNPDDLYSAAKLAQIYSRQRGDPEAALPHYLSIYRRNPSYADGEPAESTIQATLEQRARQALMYVGVEKLEPYFLAEDAAVRAEACVKAGQVADSRWIDSLAALLDDDADAVRRAAVDALAKIRERYPGAILARREEWLSDPRPLARAEALSLFAEQDPENTFPWVLTLLKDPVPAVRYFAKTRVFDRCYKSPLAAKARYHYLQTETDPAALALLRRAGRRGY